MGSSIVRRGGATTLCCLGLAVALTAATDSALAADTLDFARLAALRQVGEAVISPDGSRVAYVVRVPRSPGRDDDGAPWKRLHVVDVDGGAGRVYIDGEVSVSRVRFTPDGRQLTYLAKREGDEHAALWAIPVDGGESRRWTEHDEKILAYRVSPAGDRVAFIASEPEDEARKEAKEKGYKQQIYEEDWRPRRLWIVPVPSAAEPEDPSAEVEAADKDGSDGEPLPVEGSVFDVDWSPDGRSLVLGIAPTPLIDDRYMARRIRVVDAEDGRVTGRLDNPGKLGRFAVSPDGRHVAAISAADPNDPREGRLLVGKIEGGELRDVMAGVLGHVRDFAWQDPATVMFVLDQGVETVLGEVDVKSRRRKTHLTSDPASGSPLLSALSLTGDGRRAALIGQSPSHPAEVFTMGHGESRARRISNVNPWLSRVSLARQEVVTWKARDGLELEGLLLHPLHHAGPKPPPLWLMVHGGPESHDRNGWVTSYSRPGQLAAGRGFAVLYPNYRGSTGRGVKFAKLSQTDAAGKEFDDLVDAVEELAERGLVDRDRVGVNGGSYGGYATAWLSTRYTEQFKAGVMFVGISNKVSKGLTTEIPVEDKMVHTRFDPWTRWEFSLERSPVFYAEQSRTALLIAGGTADTRVHPSQSLQLYRALKLIGKTPVRYVRYPGEGHGNSKAAARDDFTRRIVRWMEHFVMRGETELPPWELEIPALAPDEDD